MAHLNGNSIKITNQSSENITENTIAINSNNPDLRMKYVLERLVTHLHDFARETRLSTAEWMTGIEFLTQVGKICSDVRQEFILLSDVLGLSVLVDSMDHPKPKSATEGTVLGPFHTHDAVTVSHGDNISRDVNGEPLLVACTIRDTKGRPLSGVKVDIWETDSTGHYDVQYEGYSGPDGRCLLETDDEGVFWFKAIVPVSYPIPHDGPVGKLLEKLHRHPYRPAHMHFILEKSGFDQLVTALYVRDDPYIFSDAVFGVKDTLIVDLSKVDEQTSQKYGNTPVGSKMLTYDFVMVTEEEARELRDKESLEALQKLGIRCSMYDGLPVPDVD